MARSGSLKSSLKDYNRKRDFAKTAEPKGARAGRTGGHRFVIQKHAASHLHYDFRLELDGTLKSWAVPKGIPIRKGEKRLAIQVEDHPLSYIDFEGTIPKGQYGGGTVMVWDRGTFEPLSPSPAKDLAAGKLHFVLHGKKLEGEWHLVRMGDGKQWLLIKSGSDQEPISSRQDDTSALSRKTMGQLAGGDNVRKSRSAPEAAAEAKAATRRKGSESTTFIEPMKARLLASPPSSGDWIYEVKFDGYRAMAFKKNSAVRLLSRNNKELGEKFPEVADSIARVKAEQAIIDGEIVALDAEGRSSFQLLQAYALGEKRPPIVFYAFDLLRLNGKDLRKEPLPMRKARLAELLKKAGGFVRYSASLEGRVEDLLKESRRLGLEGLIGKRKDSVYEAGQRSGAWIKLKLHHEQEMVIGGFTDPEGTREHFGALLVGYYEKGALRFAGKVGTGFNRALLEDLHTRLRKVAQKECPFADEQVGKGASSAQGLTVQERLRSHWVKPALVGQVKFSEWTRDGKLRQPVFLGLREDKNPKEVVREIAR